MEGHTPSPGGILFIPDVRHPCIESLQCENGNCAFNLPKTMIEECLPSSSCRLVGSWVREGGCVRLLPVAIQWRVSRKDTGAGSKTIQQQPGGQGRPLDKAPSPVCRLYHAPKGYSNQPELCAPAQVWWLENRAETRA